MPSRTWQYLGHLKVVDPGEQTSARVQHLGGPSAVEEALTVDAGHEPERDHPASGVTGAVYDRRHWQQPL